MLNNLAQLPRYRGLIQSLVARELKARYRGSVLGMFWSFGNPLLLILVYSTVFHYFVAARADVQPYALFLCCGLLPWTWFAASLNESTNSLIAGGNLIKKVLFPAEILPIVSVLANMVQFLLALPILAVFLIYYANTPIVGADGVVGEPRVALHLAELVWLPLVVLVQLVLTTGLALFLSALTVHFRDIRDILSNVLTSVVLRDADHLPMVFGQESEVLAGPESVHPPGRVVPGDPVSSRERVRPQVLAAGAGRRVDRDLLRGLLGVRSAA